MSAAPAAVPIVVVPGRELKGRLGAKEDVLWYRLYLEVERLELHVGKREVRSTVTHVNK